MGGLRSGAGPVVKAAQPSGTWMSRRELGTPLSAAGPGCATLHLLRGKILADGRPSPERDRSLKEGYRVPKPNYQFEKRKKDLERKKKQDEKRQRKAEKADAKVRGEGDPPPDDGGQSPS
jgi:hypothetical protein